MADEPMKQQEFSKHTGENNQKGYRDSDFILLDDLVYAPLYALAKSNHHLRAQVVEAIRNMGITKQNGQEETVYLSNINIAYDKVRPEADEGCSVDNMQLQVPLLSIVPITSLNVEKAEIDFSTEIQVVNEQDGKYQINARICSPEQRESDFLPRVSYKMKVKSIPATEGVMRITDILSANQMAKQLDTTPVAVDGNLGSEDQKNIKQEVGKLKAKVKKLRQLYQKISDMIAEQERLQQISQDAYADITREFDKDKYLMAQSNIANRIMEYQEKIMNREIEFGLEKDYE